MNWNYRVMFRDGQHAVHEVFYGDDGAVQGFTEHPVFPRGESLTDLVEDLERYQRAISEPVLDYAELEHPPAARPAGEDTVNPPLQGGS
jgi:hypothetical protein